MTGERTIQVHFERELAKREAAAREPDDGATPQQKLVRAAESGRFETLVAAAQPAEPPTMVTPEEREAELRAQGQWTEKAKPKRKAAPKRKPKEPKRTLTPNEQYIEEHCQWRARGPGDWREPIPYGRCRTEYDVLTGEMIGDGFARSSEEDDEW
jgi:hypothetical protein